MNRIDPRDIPDGSLVFIGSKSNHWLPQIWRREGEGAVHVFSSRKDVEPVGVKIEYLAQQQHQRIWWYRLATQADLDRAQALHALLLPEQFEEAYKKLAEGE